MKLNLTITDDSAVSIFDTELKILNDLPPQLIVDMALEFVSLLHRVEKYEDDEPDMLAKPATFSVVLTKVDPDFVSATTALISKVREMPVDEVEIEVLLLAGSTGGSWVIAVDVSAEEADRLREAFEAVNATVVLK